MPRSPRCLLAAMMLVAAISPFARGAEVIINEIMYNPDGSDTYTEYIELYNTGSEEIDLQGWLIADSGGQDTLRAEGDTALLPAGGYAIILETDYGSDGYDPYGSLIPGGTLMLVINDAAIGSGGLLNSISETVSLLDASGVVVSSRAYLPNAPGGVSEERIDAAGGEEDDNWSFSSYGGTPGTINSVTPMPNDLSLDTFFVAGTDPLLFEIQLSNVGLEETGSGRFVGVVIEDPSGETLFDDQQSLGALMPGEEEVVDWQFSPATGGTFTFEAFLSPQDDRPVSDTLRGEFTVAYSSGAARIVEVMPDPPSAVDVEWVEIVNRSEAAISFGSWSFEDASGSVGIIPQMTILLQPDSLLLLAADSSLLQWPGLPANVMLFVPEVWPSLNNGGDTLRLRDGSGALVDVVAYPSANEGVALQRNVESSVPSISDWTTSRDPSGGTPGVVNPVYPPRNDLALDTITISGTNSPALNLAISNCGTEVSSLGREVVISLTRPSDSFSLADTLQLTALSPGEVYLASLELAGLGGGVYSAIGWLTPADDYAENDTCRTEVVLPFESGTLRIVEVMPDPPSSVDVEWVEVINRSGTAVAMAGWAVEDAAGTRGAVPETVGLLLPDSVVVFAADSTLLEWPGLPPTLQLFMLSSWPSLNNGGDTLRLFDPSGSLADEIAYPPAEAGVSLQRTVEENTPNSLHWSASMDESGGTPGRINPELIPMDGIEKPSVSVTPNPFSPDGDGREDETTFQFRFPSSQIEVTLRLFDRIGRPVGVLLLGKVMPGAYDWLWDGRSGLDRGKLPVGIYVWYIEAIDPATGKSWQLKGTLVSAGG